MKTILLIATFVTGFTTSGCIVYERRTVPNRVVVQETTVSPAPRVITVCLWGIGLALTEASTITIMITYTTAGTPPAAMRSSRLLRELGQLAFWCCR